MSQCQRCGATNDPTSRFCVACGTPLSGSRASMPVAPQPVHTARPPAPSPSGGHPQARPSPSSPQQQPSSVVVPYDGPPPSSGFQFAETAAPQSGPEFEARRAAALAAAAAAAAQGPPAAGWAAPPPGQYAPAPGQYQPAAAPVAAYPAGAAPATAQMPGVSQDPELVPEGAPRILAAFLVSYDTQPLGRFWPIFQGKNRVGRQGAAPDLDLELDHPTASSRHAIILAAACPGRLKIEDMGSTNGTLVNGMRLQAGVRHELQDGDRVRFGLLSTIVKIV